MSEREQKRRGTEGGGEAFHQELLATIIERFPEESYHQLRAAGASETEALQMLGFSADRKPLKSTTESDRPG